MKKLLSLLLAVLVALSLPMTALAAITVDTSYGDSFIYDETADYYDTNGDYNEGALHGGEVTVQHGDGGMDGTVIVHMDGGEVTINGDVNGDFDARSDANVTVDGDVNCNIDARDGANVTIDGDVNGYVSAGDANVGVGGDVNGYVVAWDNANVTVDGNVNECVNAYDNADVGVGGDVNGYVSAGDANVGVGGDVNGEVSAMGDAEVTVDGDVNGYVDAEENANVTVDGNVNGGVMASDAEVTVKGDVTGTNGSEEFGYGSSGVDAYGSSKVVVEGDVSGGTGTGSDLETGDGVYMESTAEVTVGGNVTGGIGVNGADGGYGVTIGVTGGKPGSLTVKGSVCGGQDTDGTEQVDICVFSNYLEENNPVEGVPAITVGSYDSLDVAGFSEEEAQEIADNIKVAGIPTPSAPAVTVVEEAPARSGGSTSGYSKGALWRGGYITRTLFKVENGAGMKPLWSEELENGILTITAENEPVVFTVWLEGLKELKKLGVETILIKTADCETELILADLIALNGTEYILTQEGETATLSVDGTNVEI